MLYCIYYRKILATAAANFFTVKITVFFLFPVLLELHVGLQQLFSFSLVVWSIKHPKMFIHLSQSPRWRLYMSHFVQLMMQNTKIFSFFYLIKQKTRNLSHLTTELIISALKTWLISFQNQLQLINFLSQNRSLFSCCSRSKWIYSLTFFLIVQNIMVNFKVLTAALFNNQVPPPPPIKANWTPCEPLALYCPPSMTRVRPEERNIALIHSAHTHTCSHREA